MSKKSYYMLILMIMFIILGCNSNSTNQRDQNNISKSVSNEANKSIISTNKTNSKINNKDETFLEQSSILQNPNSNKKDFQLIMVTYLEMWKDATISTQAYEKLKRKNLLKILESLYSYYDETKQISPQFIKAVNQYLKTQKDHNSLRVLFANYGLLILREEQGYDILVPKSNNFQKDFGKITTNLQKKEVFNKYKDNRVLWKGIITDVNEGTIVFKNLKSTSLLADVMINRVDMNKQELLKLNSGDLVWYTGILNSMDGAVFPWGLSEGQVVGIIKKSK